MPRSTCAACPWWRWRARCMEAGKTAAASAIIARMRHRGLVVDAFKATGVSLRRDILAFEDSGARRTMIFTDFGIVTTTEKCGPALTRIHADRNGERPAGCHRVRTGRRPVGDLRRAIDSLRGRHQARR